MLRADIKVSWIKMRAAAPEAGELLKMQFLWEKNYQSYGTLAAGADCTLCPDSGGALIALILARRALTAAMLVVTAGLCSDGRDTDCRR
jgi:hypothetical protein